MSINFKTKRVNLASVAAQKLAKVHKLIVNGYLLVGTMEHQNRERTGKFWGEVGKDEIHWWIFKKEMNVKQLKERTENTLSCAKILKDDSKRLNLTFAPKSYRNLIEVLDKFVDDHEEEITQLCDYVEKLYEENVLAPSILFTYRVWGTTRQLERTSISKSGDPVLCEDLKECLETALGTVIRSKPTAYRVLQDLKNELNLDDFEFKEFIQCSEGVDRWLQIATRKVFEEFTDYFDNIHQSLRNILLEIEMSESIETLINDLGFWSEVILSTLKNPIETQLWDFKQTLEMWHCRGEEKMKSIVHICEEVASFANAKGGVILIGVTDEPPRRVIGVTDVEDKIKYLSDAIRKYCVYPKSFTIIQQVPFRGQNGIIICIVIAIAQTKGVVSVTDNNGMFTFPIRSQTGIARLDQRSIELSKEDVLKDNYNFISELYKITFHGFISFSYE